MTLLPLKLTMSVAPPSIEVLNMHPDRPHRYLPHAGRVDYSCRACGGSGRHPVHMEPLGGWPG